MIDNCAPIIIATLNRSEHFIRLIESLKKNTWAKYTDVYIGLDYPPSEKYVEGYMKICQYLAGEFSEFASFNIFKREYNYGSIKNLADLRNYVLERYDRFIRADDDAEFAPNFLEYINKCLDKYELDDEIVGVTGYSYPLTWRVSHNANIFKESFICPSWGTGFWKRKYLCMCEFIESGRIASNINDFISSDSFKSMLTTSKMEFINLCLASPNLKNTFVSIISDISIRLYMVQVNKCVIMPVISKVRNWGFDGTGEYCKDYKKRKGKLNAYNYPYHAQCIDDSLDFSINEDQQNAIEYNRRLYDRFDSLPIGHRVKAWTKLQIYRLLGSDFLYKLLNLKSR